MKFKFKTLAAIAAAALFGASILSGCTANPYTGEKQASKTAVGVGGGAAGGALIGQLIGHSTQATLIGAGVGAVAGGLVGGYMDHQDAELRAQLANSGVQVARNGKNIQLIMPGDVTFDNDQASIKPQFQNTLNSVAIVLKKYNKTTIKVAGYTSSTGSDAHNQTLSEQRAASVASYLISHGVSSNRVFSVGYGKRYPVASNKTAAGQAQNRRVVININQ